QAAATAAWADDAHVEGQRARYAERRRYARSRLAEARLVDAGGPSSFYLWARSADPAEGGWAVTARLAETGTLVAAGDLYVDGEVVVHEWLKQAILLCFRLRGLETIELGPFEYHDRIPLKHGFAEARVRAVPGASARWGSYLGPGVTLMPSYVNIGAYVGEGSMVDTWATVGSCAQVGKRVHL